MKSSKKLSQRIQSLKAELAKAKAAEKTAANAEAAKVIRRAVANSGLIALVRAEKLSAEQLADEFKLITTRAASTTRPIQNTPPQHSSAGFAPEPTDVSKSPFWNR